MPVRNAWLKELADAPSHQDRFEALGRWATTHTQLLHQLYRLKFEDGIRNFNRQHPKHERRLEEIDHRDHRFHRLIETHMVSVAKMHGELNALAAAGADQSTMDRWFNENERRIEQQGDVLEWSAEQHGYKLAGDGSGMLIDWELDPEAKHCDDCPDFAANSPYTSDSLPAIPGDGSTECGGNCRCSLNYREETPDQEAPTVVPNLGQIGGASNFWPMIHTAGDAAAKMLGLDDVQAVADLEGKTVAETIERVEAAIANEPYEYAAAIDRDGHIVMFTTDLNPVALNFDTQQMDDINRAVTLIHNHPPGGSFSITDVYGAIGDMMSEIRVVSRDTEYLLRLPIERITVAEQDRLVKQLDELQRYAEAHQGEWTNDFWHNLWSTAADRFGWTYERIGPEEVRPYPVRGYPTWESSQAAAAARRPSVVSYTDRRALAKEEMDQGVRNVIAESGRTRFTVVVRDENGQIVGAANYDRFGKDIDIYDVHISGDVQRQGYGRMLFQYLADQTRDDGTITVHNATPNGRAFYQHLGAHDMSPQFKGTQVFDPDAVNALRSQRLAAAQLEKVQRPTRFFDQNGYQMNRTNIGRYGESIFGRISSYHVKDWLDMDPVNDKTVHWSAETAGTKRTDPVDFTLGTPRKDGWAIELKTINIGSDRLRFTTKDDAIGRKLLWMDEHDYTKGAWVGQIVDQQTRSVYVYFMEGLDQQSDLDARAMEFVGRFSLDTGREMPMDWAAADDPNAPYLDPLHLDPLDFPPSRPDDYEAPDVTLLVPFIKNFQ